MKRRKSKETKTEEAARGAPATQAVEAEEVAEPNRTNAPITAEPGEVENEGATPEQPADTVESLRTKVAELENNLLRAKADYQNLQRRAAKEHTEAVRYANGELMKSLLGVVDDFERSLAAAESSDENQAVVDGVRLVYENFRKALRSHGLEEIDAWHRPFDPHIHEAIMQQPTADHPPGTVIDEVVKGYSLCDRVLRPSRVIVSKALEPEQASESRVSAGGKNESDRNEDAEE